MAVSGFHGPGRKQMPFLLPLIVVTLSLMQESRERTLASTEHLSLMTISLKKLFERFGLWKSSQAGTPISERERISRFLVQSSHFAKSKAKVKVGAFMPPTSGKLSICRSEGLTEAEIWQIGLKYVASQSRSVKARADLLASDILSTGYNGKNLAIDADGKPHIHHANIIGWPDERSQKLLLAIILADAAILIVI